MSLTSTRNSICNSMAQQFGPIIATVRNARSAFRDKVAEFSAELRAQRNLLVNPQDVLQAVTDLQGQIQGHLPGSAAEDMEELRRFLSTCSFFGDANPVGTLLGGTLGVYDKLDGFIDDLAVSVPAIGLGKLADAINDVLNGITLPGGNNIAPLLATLDKILECLCGGIGGLCPNAVFGDEYYNFCSQALDDVNDLYDDFNVEHDTASPDYGRFIFSSVYADAGLNAENIQCMEYALNGFGSTPGITGIKSGMSSSIASAANAAKSLIKSGGFF